MSKRANYEGSISKRSDGRWQIRYYDDKGVRRCAYAKSQQEAKDKLQELKNQVSMGLDVSQSGLRFADWLKTWLSEYAKPNIKLSTYGSYHTYIYKHVAPNFTKLLLKDLRPDHLQKFMNEKATGGRLDGKEAGLSGNTIRKIKIMIGTALGQAVDNGLILRNPAEMVKAPVINYHEMRVLTLAEQDALEQTCLESSELAAFGVYLALNTGMRLGEILGLTWNNVDLDKEIIYIRQTLNRLQTFKENGQKTVIEIGTPKSHCSRREIPLFNGCLKRFRAYRKRQEAHIDKFEGAYEDMGFVFTPPLGKYMEPKTFQDLFKRQIKLSGILEANFHAMRHTFATRSLEAGMDIYVLSRILGHAQASTTLNKYGHALPDHKRASMEKLEEYRNKNRVS